MHRLRRASRRRSCRRPADPGSRGAVRAACARTTEWRVERSERGGLLASRAGAEWTVYDHGMQLVEAKKWPPACAGGPPWSDYPFRLATGGGGAYPRCKTSRYGMKGLLSRCLVRPIPMVIGVTVAFPQSCEVPVLMAHCQISVQARVRGRRWLLLQCTQRRKSVARTSSGECLAPGHFAEFVAVWVRHDRDMCSSSACCSRAAFCSQICRGVESIRSMPRTTSVMPCKSSSTTTASW